MTHVQRRPYVVDLIWPLLLSMKTHKGHPQKVPSLLSPLVYFYGISFLDSKTGLLKILQERHSDATIFFFTFLIRTAKGWNTLPVSVIPAKYK